MKTAWFLPDLANVKVVEHSLLCKHSNCEVPRPGHFLLLGQIAVHLERPAE